MTVGTNYFLATEGLLERFFKSNGNTSFGNDMCVVDGVEKAAG